MHSVPETNDNLEFLHVHPRGTNKCYHLSMLWGTCSNFNKMLITAVSEGPATKQNLQRELEIFQDLYMITSCVIYGDLLLVNFNRR